MSTERKRFLWGVVAAAGPVAFAGFLLWVTERDAEILGDFVAGGGLGIPAAMFLVPVLMSRGEIPETAKVMAFALLVLAIGLFTAAVMQDELTTRDLLSSLAVFVFAVILGYYNLLAEESVDRA